MNRSVYITRLSKFLPNAPVSNDEIEQVLGLINGVPSKARPLILRNNQIKQRYYAIDRQGNTTHTNAELTRLAVEGLFDAQFGLEQLQLLSCGTTSPDQLLPAHAAMVHGLLGGNHVEINSTTGACSAGIQALKFGYLSVLSGNTDNAACTGSERFAKWMSAPFFQEEAEKLAELEKDGMIAFDKDFLRFMLSDGAGAALLESKPNETGLSLRIEWIEQRSYAHELPTCMYAGSLRNEDGSITGWSDIPTDQWTEQTVFAIKQDTKLLGEYIVKKGGQFLKELVNAKGIDPSSISYFLPHLSSQYFGPRIAQEMELLGLDFPVSKWFTNLSRVGNVGAGSAFLMLEELFHSGRVKKGEQLLMMVPESARFNYAYILMTAV